MSKIYKLYICEWPWMPIEVGKIYPFALEELSRSAVDSSERFSEVRFVDFYEEYKDEISKLRIKKVKGFTCGLIDCYTLSVTFDELFNSIGCEYIELPVVQSGKIWTVLENDRLASEDELKKLLKYRKRK